MKKLQIFFSLLIFLLFSTSLPAIEIVLERGVERYSIAVADFESNTETGNQIRNVVIANFSAYPQFHVIRNNLANISRPIYRGSRVRPNFDDWRNTNAQFVVFARINESNQRIQAEFGVFDIHARGIIINKQIASSSENWRFMAHQLSSEIFYSLTGKKPAFTSRIAFVSDAPGETEIYLMDWDGHNVSQVTRQRALIVAPSWALNNRYLFYTSYRNVNPDLYRFDMTTGKTNLISDSPLQNLGAQYSPVRKRVVLALGKDGNPELYSIDINGQNRRRLTETSRAIESDPHWSPCGKYVVFSSDRTGGQRLYTLDYDTTQTRRLVRQEILQSEPSWSVNNVIAFTTRVNRLFQVATVNADGSNLRVLTEGNFDSEQPAWSPCGEFIYYVSNREGNKRIYRMNADGSNKTMLTRTNAECKNPAVSERYY